MVAHMINQHNGSCLLLPLSPLASSSIRATHRLVTACQAALPIDHSVIYVALARIGGCKPFLSQPHSARREPSVAPCWTGDRQTGIVLPHLWPLVMHRHVDSGHLIDDVATNGCPSKLHALYGHLINELRLVRVVCYAAEPIHRLCAPLHPSSLQFFAFWLLSLLRSHSSGSVICSVALDRCRIGLM